MAAAVAAASATGIMLRGFHSKSSSSTASSTDATGAAKVADMPAAAPATSSLLRSVLVRWKNCAMSDPIAPPVMMIGPSAPNGPPDPMEIPDDTGFSSATFGSTRLPLIRMASIASGMPWPRIRSDPYRAITPMISAPITGTSTTIHPSVWSAGDTSAVLKRWKKNRLVKKLISLSSSQATNPQMNPIAVAISEMVMTRGVVVKSPRSCSSAGPGPCRSDALSMCPAPPCSAGGLVEEHDRRLPREVHLGGQRGHRMRERPPPAGRQALDGVNQPRLRGIGGARDQAPALRRQPQLEPAGISGGRRAQHEAALHQLGDDGRHRALVRVRARGEVVQRGAGALAERLQHEQLGAAEADLLLGRARRLVQLAHDPPHRVENPPRLVRTAGCMGTHISFHHNRNASRSR